MRIWAIDPGTYESAYVLWTGEEVLDKGFVENLEILSLPIEIGDLVVIEGMQMYSKGGVGNDVFDTLLWSGRMMQYVIDCDAEVRFIVRSNVRFWHCKTMDSGDPQVRQAIIDRYGGVSTKSSPNPVYGGDYKNKMRSHLWNSLAIAIICSEDPIYFKNKSFTLPRS